MLRWIKKGLLHLDQKELDGGKDRKNGERGERRSSIYWSLVFEQASGSTGQEASWTALQEVGVLSYSS